MTSNTHTPGPWAIYPPRNAASHMPQIGSAMSDGTPYIVAQVCGGIGKHGRENNARLIAASPDLYEALREMLRVQTTHEVPPLEFKSAMDAARAALAQVQP